MINSSHGVLFIIARQVRVKNLTAEFMRYVVYSVIEIVYSAGDRVFSLTCDDSSLDEKTHEMLHETFDSLDVTLIPHPYKNSKFEVLFTLFDAVYLFKILETIGVLKKPKLLEFQNPQTTKKCIANWKDLNKICKGERDSSILREKKLDYTTLHPNDFKNQKLYLVVNIFNERAVVKLEGRERMEGIRNLCPIFSTHVKRAKF